jgi:NADH-quinone oxidoreductase subunit N
MAYPILDSILLMPVFITSTHFISILPELFLTLTTIFLLIYNVFAYKSIKNYTVTLSTSYIYILLLLFTLFLLLFNSYSHGSGILVFNNLLILDYYGLIIKSIIILSAIILFLISFSYIRQENIFNFEYILLTGFAVLALMFFISSFDTFAMYMSLELLSLSLYILAAFKTNSMYSAEAGIKYITLGALSSGIMLYGISMLYGNVANLDFLSLKTHFLNISMDELSLINIGMMSGIICIFVGFLFKISAVPFHMWTPDVYEGAPTPITAFFAITVKFGIFCMFLRLLFYVFIDVLPMWQDCILFAAVASMIIGCLGALFQRKIKRLAAYSSINHIGYLLLGVATGTFEGLQSILLYLILYVLMNLVFFAGLLACYDSTKNRRIMFISDLSSIGKSNPLLGFGLAITLLSLAGIPPLAGFFSKYYLFLSVIHSQMYIYAIIGIVTSVLSTFYYIRVVKVIFFENTDNNLKIDSFDNIKQNFFIISLIILLGFCLVPQIGLDFCYDIAYSLMYTFSYNLV